MHWMVHWLDDKTSLAACDALENNDEFFPWLARRGYRPIWYAGRFGHHAWGCV